MAAKKVAFGLVTMYTRPTVEESVAMWAEVNRIIKEIGRPIELTQTGCWGRGKHGCSDRSHYHLAIHTPANFDRFNTKEVGFVWGNLLEAPALAGFDKLEIVPGVYEGTEEEIFQYNADTYEI